ncbi:MAG: hypothetical protein KGL53_07190, partial [Elusimicrobia bacterium]|nr:hypothetical protein [Elusimicrobiota bacterium]
RVAFRAPERLSSWRVSGYVLTKDAAYGLVEAQAVTRKELMVRVEMPRFLREGDRAVLKAVVSNGTGRELAGAVSLSVRRGREDAAAALGLEAAAQGFRLPPHGTAGFSWTVQVPEGLASYKVTAAAEAGRRADAETRELPVLPARQRLVESVVTALSGTVERSLTAPALTRDDPSRVDELARLQVDPQLALTALHALPFLVEYPYECVEQTLNRWLPSAVMAKVYARDPALAAAAAKLPKRDTVTPPWEMKDPARLMTLMETPYLGVARGLESPYPVIDMLDPKTVAANEASALERLRASQRPDGSFPWFPGGEGDLYMTLYVLDGLAQARRYGVATPDDLARRALGYAMRELPHRVAPDEEDVAFLLYASYVVTSFPADLASLPEVPEARLMARAWLDFAGKHSDAMTRLGKAYASYAYRNLGDDKQAELYLDRALDAARTDPVTGTYWTPEKDSWRWYEDGLETQAFLIRAVETLRPDDSRLPGMVQWVLFDRKGGVWKSTKASAAAIYALLDYMRKTGSLEQGDTFTVHWGGLSDAVRVGPLDWLSMPLRWSKPGRLTAADATARVTKTGPGFAFASLTHVYTTTAPVSASEPGLLTLRRSFFLRVKEGDAYRLVPLARGATVHVGDAVVVRLALTSRGRLEYVHVKDPRGAGFEAESLRSGWTYDGLVRYEEPRDSLTNDFVDRLPQGEYDLDETVRPTTPGRYRIAAAVAQSMYAPEFAAHSADFELVVAE